MKRTLLSRLLPIGAIAAGLLLVRVGWSMPDLGVPQAQQIFVDNLLFGPDFRVGARNIFIVTLGSIMTIAGGLTALAMWARGAPPESAITLDATTPGHRAVSAPPETGPKSDSRSLVERKP